MKIYKLRPKFHFFDKKIDKNDSLCVFVLLFFEKTTTTKNKTKQNKYTANGKEAVTVKTVKGL